MSRKQLEQEPSWLPVPGETSSAYAAFCIYRDLGIGRKLTQVVKILESMPNGGMNYGSIHEWCHKFGWEQRILDYDARLARERASAELAETKKSVRQIERERIERVRLNLAVADQLRMRGLEMLDYPLFLKTEEKRTTAADGTTTIVQNIFNPTKWTPKDAVSCLKAATDMEKVAIFDTEARAIDADPEKLNVAGDQIAAWRQAQMKQIQDIPANPPGTLTNPIDVSEPETESEPDAA